MRNTPTRHRRVTIPRPTRSVWLLAKAWLTGLMDRPRPSVGPDTLLFVPGAAGDGVWYDGLVRGLWRGGVRDRVETFAWGGPTPLVLLNAMSDSVHADAEEQLCRRIAQLRAQDPRARITLLGHSAGAGVVLGALARLAPEVTVRRVVILGAMMSSDYDLAPALAHVEAAAHVFVSDRDTVFLDRIARLIGTYDHAHAPAAGFRGFRTDELPDALRRKVVQHPYDPAWQLLGNDGGHFGTEIDAFAAHVLAPLLIERRVYGPHRWVRSTPPPAAVPQRARQQAMRRGERAVTSLAS